MMGWKTVITVVGLSLVLAGSGYADLTWPDSDSAAPLRTASDLPWLGERFPGPWNEIVDDGISDPFRVWGENLPEHFVETGGATEAGRRHVLADERGSLTFCLYGLLGLGFLKSVPCARRLPVNAIPAWYHEGGPAEIGQCLAISSGCLYPASIGFVPLPDRADDLRPLYRLGIVAALWRTSQSVPTVLAPRAPPTHSS